MLKFDACERMQPQMVRELGAIIRNQIPSGRKSVLEAYGEILYRAWRESTAACLLEVENQVQVTEIPFCSLHIHGHCQPFPG